jgi:aspartate 4-decarboxylase
MTTEVFEEPCDKYYKIFTDGPTEGDKYKFLSPFEFKNILLKSAHKSKMPVLNAGRGNPNFFQTDTRRMFSILNTICLDISSEDADFYQLGYIPDKKGLFDKMQKYMRKTKYGTKSERTLLLKLFKGMKKLNRGTKKDDFAYDLFISVIGCFYPDPPRIQNFLEPVLTEYLEKKIYRTNKPLKEICDNTLKLKVKIMPTEGAAAAILYVFNSLKYNGLVVPGDSIAIMTPIFSPYLEIPTLRNYNLRQICINADENNNWEVPMQEIEKLADPNIKALFLVNPTNPTGLSLSKETVNKMAKFIRKFNPYLIILEDNVYAPFVNEFHDFFNVLPKNTIGVYSFSKYFGTTGYRLGTIVMHNRNIIDSTLLVNRPEELREEINERYRMISTNPAQIKFMDRILADSRQVAEAHVAGLSTPQQTQMGLMAMNDLLDTDDVYKTNLEELLKVRMNSLLNPLEFEIKESGINTNYYVVIDILKVVDKLTGGGACGNYMLEHRDPLEFLIKLAKKYGTVLLPAVGFAGPFWGVRASLANLETELYAPIGQNVRALVDEYIEDFKLWQRKQLVIQERES